MSSPAEDITIDDIFRRLEERIEYNRHDMGELGMFIRVGYVKNFLKEVKQELQHHLVQETNKARSLDQYGNPMVQLNMYEAKAVAGCLEKLATSPDRYKYDTGDWFLDIPRKITEKGQV